MRPRKLSRRADRSRSNRSLALELDGLENRLLLSQNPVGYSPYWIRTAYGITTASGANNTTLGSTAADGTWQTIALVEEGNDPYIELDLEGFDSQYPELGSPPNVNVYDELGNAISPALTFEPATVLSGEETEEDMDVEWAHAIAPGANIDIIECNVDTNSVARIADLII
jgi:subtilase family serine protease